MNKPKRYMNGKPEQPTLDFETFVKAALETGKPPPISKPPMRKKPVRKHPEKD